MKNKEEIIEKLAEYIEKYRYSKGMTSHRIADAVFSIIDEPVKAESISDHKQKEKSCKSNIAKMSCNNKCTICDFYY